VHFRKLNKLIRHDLVKSRLKRINHVGGFQQAESDATPVDQGEWMAIREGT